MNQHFPFDSEEIENQILSNKIEVFIQQTENINIPAIIFEYNTKEKINFDENDLIEFYEQFGEIEDFQLKGKISIVLFTTFFSVNTCKEFLENKKNFRDNINNNFSVRWFDYEKDYDLISEESKEKYESIMMKNITSLKKKSLLYFNDGYNNFNNNINNPINNSNRIQQNILNISQNPFIYSQQNILNMNMGINILNQNNINMQIPNIFFTETLNTGINEITQNKINNKKINQINKLNNSNNKNKKNSPSKLNLKVNNLLEEKSNSNKYTCKYEILIPNDNEFKISRRLIGNKGYNMKNIIDKCKLYFEQRYNNINNINDIIKLRLRGRGSGYKEGRHNKESDEPLHLCISSKFKEGLIKACKLVDDLIDTIFEDYKKYCIKKGINIPSKLAHKILGNFNYKKNSNLYH